MLSGTLCHKDKRERKSYIDFDIRLKCCSTIEISWRHRQDTRVGFNWLTRDDPYEPAAMHNNFA